MSVDLAALVASPHFRWMPGMLARCTNFIHGYKSAVRVRDGELVDGQPVNDSWVAVPDLADPATRGCLLHLVREAWGDPCMFVEHVTTGPSGTGWRLVGHSLDPAGCSYWSPLGTAVYATERDAAVAALLAAPPKELVPDREAISRKVSEGWTDNGDGSVSIQTKRVTPTKETS